MVGESPEPMQQDNVADGGDTVVHNCVQRKHAQEHTTSAGRNNIPTTTMPIESTTYPDMGEGDADGCGM
jgi:hypothetical protein